MKVFLLLALLPILGLAEDNPSGQTFPSPTTVSPNSTTSSPSPPSTTGGPSTTTTEDPLLYCGNRNGSCDECVKGGTKCYYCYKTKTCSYYKYNKLIPVEECGSLEDMAWGTCVINFEVLIISLSVVGGVIVISLIICCCCCCRKHKRGLWAKEQAKFQQQREELKMRTEDRKRERQTRTDEIRRKYGLMKDDNPYQRFEA